MCLETPARAPLPLYFQPTIRKEPRRDISSREMLRPPHALSTGAGLGVWHNTRVTRKCPLLDELLPQHRYLPRQPPRQRQSYCACSKGLDLLYLKARFGASPCQVDQMRRLLFCFWLDSSMRPGGTTVCSRVYGQAIKKRTNNQGVLAAGISGPSY
jgi:hypothetical protein